MAASLDVHEVFVEQCSDNPGAIAFYRAQGYRVQGVVSRYYGGAIDAVRLSRRFVPVTAHE